MDKEKEQLQNAVRTYNSRLEEVDRQLAEYRRAASRVQSLIPADAGPGDIQQLNHVLTNFNQTSAAGMALAQSWSAQGPASIVMYDHALTWWKIAADAGIIADRLQVNDLPSRRRWEGNGAEAYFGVVGQQNRASLKIVDLAKEVSNALKTNADTMLIFYTSAGGVLLSIIDLIRDFVRTLQSFASAVLIALRWGARGSWRALRGPFALMLRRLVSIWGELVQRFGVVLTTVGLVGLAGTASASIIGRWFRANQIMIQAQGAFPESQWPTTDTTRYNDSSRDTQWDVQRPR